MDHGADAVLQQGPDRGAEGAHADATAYLGTSGRTALRLSAEYDLLLTQRLILQPRIEANLYGENDREVGIGSGLSNGVVGVRLRYELSRHFAPYVGIERYQRSAIPRT
jgi:copper resistance protein B